MGSLTDVVIIVMLVFFTFLGGRRGLVAELSGLTGWIISFLGALALCDIPAAIVAEKVPRIKGLSTFISFVVLLFLFRAILQVFVNALKNTTKGKKPGYFNFAGGSLLGFVQGLFLISVIVLTITVVPFKQSIKAVKNNSLLYHHTEYFSVYIVKTVAKFIPKTKQAVDKIVVQLKSKPTSIKKVESQAKEMAKEAQPSREEIEKKVMEDLKKARQQAEELRR